MAGICLIRLSQLRPAGLPAALGVTTENAAHRIAVEWDGPDGLRHGVYIPRRDSSSLLTTLLGGRLFPGEHHRARFSSSEVGGCYEVLLESLDGTAGVTVRATAARDLPADSIFASLADASRFFEQSPLGYSPGRRPARYDALELRCAGWQVEPLVVEHAESSFFDNAQLFPAGTTELDSALVMRDIPATWHARHQVVGAASLGERDLRVAAVSPRR